MPCWWSLEELLEAKTLIYSDAIAEMVQDRYNK
jgi:hypothetical protein